MQIDRFFPLRKPARRRRIARNQEHRASAEIETVEQRCLLSAVVTGPSGTVDTPTPTITWSAMDGATSYDLWISQVGPDARRVLETPTGLPGTSYVPADLPDGTIRVWVRSNMADGSKSDWSAFHDFEVAVPATFTAPSVAGGANPNLNTSTPTLEWTAAEGNQRFEIFLSDKSRVKSKVIQIYDATRRSFTFDDADALGIGQFEVFIRAINPDGTPDDWSPPSRFRVGTAPDILRPMAPSFQNPALLEWDAVPGATGYDVFLSDADTLGAELHKADNVQDTSYQLPMALPDGGDNGYTFWVRARHDGEMVTLADGSVVTGASNEGLWSDGANFNTLKKPVIEPIPGGFTTAPFPTIRWSAVDKAARYDLWVDWSAGPAQYVRMNVRDTEYTFENKIPEGRFFVWVRAVSTRGEFTEWSDPMVFEASGGIPVITGPTGVINDPFPTITWIGVPDAVSYEVWISTDTTITSIIQQTGITSTFYEVNSPLSEGKYRVWVRATLLDGTMTAWTKPFAFEISTIVSNDNSETLDSGEIIPVALAADVVDSPEWLRTHAEAESADAAERPSETVVATDNASAADGTPVAVESTEAVQLMYIPNAETLDSVPGELEQLELHVIDQMVTGWHRIDWWSNQA